LSSHLEAIRRANVAHHLELIAAAAALGARIIGLGELFPAPYFALRRDAFWKGMAEELASSPTVAELQETAQQLQMVIVAPLYERDGDATFNTAVVIDADGAVLGRFRKCHIPRGRNEQGAFDELFYYGASNGRLDNRSGKATDHPLLPVFATAVGRIGVSICYDRHFEGMVATLASQGAQLVFSPAVTFGAKSARLWQSEFEVDAARHNVFIGGSNRAGKEAPWNQEYFGGSYFVGPNGRCPDRSTQDNLIVAELDFAELAAADPSGWNLRADRRQDI
jgi:N-carbamoylputrescine amidase